jgi:hypothetical protein
LHFDGGFQFHAGGLVVAASQPARETAARNWLQGILTLKTSVRDAADTLLQAWWRLVDGKEFDAAMPPEAERQAAWREGLRDRVVEIGWLARHSPRLARYETLTLTGIGL